jgi:Putative ATPase subunit of terminase (gpP-like)
MSAEIEERKYPPDFSAENVSELETFKADGLPGISAAPEKIDQAKKLYLEGMSFNMIAERLRIKRRIVLAWAEKFKWYGDREQNLVGMLESIAKRGDIFQVQHVHFIIELCNAIRLYYADRIGQFESTKDATVMENMNTSLMNIYLKGLESLKPRGKDDGKASSPLVNLNLQGGTVQIDGNSEAGDDLSKALKILADMNRVKDKA